VPAGVAEETERITEIARKDLTVRASSVKKCGACKD